MSAVQLAPRLAGVLHGPYFIFNAPGQIFFTVEHLTLLHKVHNQSYEEQNEIDCTEWRKLLRSFNNVKTLCVHRGLVKKLSHCLRLEDGEHPLNLLPEMQKLTYSGSSNTNDVFTSFVDARQNAGRPVILMKTLYLTLRSCDWDT